MSYLGPLIDVYLIRAKCPAQPKTNIKTLLPSKRRNLLLNFSLSILMIIIAGMTTRRLVELFDIPGAIT